MTRFKEYVAEDWNNKDDKKRIKRDRNYVSCDERYGSEKEKFEEYEKLYGKDKIDECCKRVKPPRPREEFERCLQGK